MIKFVLTLGLRGAIAFALSINLDFDQDKRHVLITTTLIIVLFTLLVLGGSTLPLLKVRYHPNLPNLYHHCVTFHLTD